MRTEARDIHRGHHHPRRGEWQHTPMGDGRIRKDLCENCSGYPDFYLRTTPPYHEIRVPTKIPCSISQSPSVDLARRKEEQKYITYRTYLLGWTE
jgi:hypothetical protein